MQTQQQAKNAKSLPGIPTGKNLPKGTKPSVPPPTSPAEKAKRKAEKKAKRLEVVMTKLKAEAEQLVIKAICDMNKPPEAVVNPINDPKISPDVPAAEVPVTIPAENDNAPTEASGTSTAAEGSEGSVAAESTEGQKVESVVDATEAPAETPVPDATGVTVAEDDIKVDDALVAESEAADKAKKHHPQKLNSPQRMTRKDRRRLAQLERNKDDTAFVAAPTPEVENKPEVDPAPERKVIDDYTEANNADVKADPLKEFAETITTIAEGVKAEAEANADRPSDTEAPTEDKPNNAPITETPPTETQGEQAPAEEAPAEAAPATDGVPTEEPVVEAAESPKAELAATEAPKKPTLTLVPNTGNGKFTDISAEIVEAAAKFYGKCFTDERAKSLATAYKWLTKAIEYEAKGTTDHANTALKAALRHEAEAFGVSMSKVA